MARERLTGENKERLGKDQLFNNKIQTKDKDKSTTVIKLFSDLWK